MFSAILILLIMPFTDLSRSRGIQFKPLSKVVFFLFVGNFLILMELGAKHVESPFIEFGQISTVVYFAYFLIIVPLVSLVENTLTELYLESDDIMESDDIRSQLPHDLIIIHSSGVPNLSNIVSARARAARPGLYGSGGGIGGSGGSGGNNPASTPNDAATMPARILKRIIRVTDARGSRVAIDTESGITLRDKDGVRSFGRVPEHQDVDAQVIADAYSDALVEEGLGVVSDANSMENVRVVHDGITDSLTQATGLGNNVHNDAPRPWGLYFQDSASPQMEALVELHNNILFYLVIILFGVGWLLIIIVRKYTTRESPISYKYSSHGTLIELIWTITPALILILIAFPSFKLLYLMDEVIDPAMAILAEGHQWYWSYQYPDFLNSDDEFIEFDSYLIPESDLEDGTLRMLEVDNRLILPEHTHIRIIVTGADVIHSLACPALGLKCDAYPGRLNQTSVIISREGTFYGQCSEICGILHSSMPIVIESVSIEKFVSWLREQ